MTSAKKTRRLDEDERLGGDRPARVGFRGIPTWEEAVGLVITKNMEARSKRSGGGPSKGRGDRGPRDNRGRGNANAARKLEQFAAMNGTVYVTMQPTKELIDELDRERVERARQMSPADRVLASLQLFELTSKIMAAGIRSQFPDADDRRVQEILRERLALSRRLEDRG